MLVLVCALCKNERCVWRAFRILIRSLDLVFLCSFSIISMKNWVLLFCSVYTLLVSRSFFAIARIYSSYILSKPLFVYLFFPLLARFFWGILVYFGELLFVLSYSFWDFLSTFSGEFLDFSFCSFLRIFGCLMKRKTLYQHSVSNVDAGCCKND